MGRGAARGVGALLLALLFIGLANAQRLQIGGSSSLYPAAALFASQVEEVLPGAAIEVSFGGTGAGFDLLCKGAIDIIGASRLATDEEKRACSSNGIEFVGFPVALDAIVLVVSDENDWLRCLTLAEVRTLWSAGPERIETWAQLRSEWPDRSIQFHAPGVASGTYDYWNGRVLGPEATMRTDYFPSEDDRRLAQLTASDPDAISFFSRAQLDLAGAGLRAVRIDDGFGCIDPEAETGLPARWPLVRPLFLYVSASAAAPDSESLRAVVSVVDSFLSEAGQERLSNMGYLPLEDTLRGDAVDRFVGRVRGPLAADYDGQAILRRLPGGWSRRQVDLHTRLLALEREVQTVGVVHRRFDTLFQSLLDDSRSGLDDSRQ